MLYIARSLFCATSSITLKGLTTKYAKNQRRIGQMNAHIYKQIIEKSPVGYAYHKIIYDQAGMPVDYEFIEVNCAFQKIIGLVDSDIMGKRVTNVLPEIEKSKFDWIKFYQDIALHNYTNEFEQYFEPLQRWYKVQIYAPEEFHMITLFTDISCEKEHFLELDDFFKTNLDSLWIGTRRSMVWYWSFGMLQKRKKSRLKSNT